MILKPQLHISKIVKVTEAKAILKESLQAEVGLPVDKNIPLIGFIGRLEEQKGSDILVEAISELIGMDVQILILVSEFPHISFSLTSIK